MNWHNYYTNGPNKKRRKAIPATCAMHRGPIGFANLLVSMQDGSIVFDPHVTGACVIAIDEQGATTLRDILTEWLGGPSTGRRGERRWGYAAGGLS